MIISTGSLKFKKVKSIKNTVLRPTSSKIREAIFNILIHKLELDKWKSEGYMLDAFAGTGIVSFEGLSRGIYHSTLVEKDLDIYNTLSENIKNLNIINNTNTINDNFFNLKSLPLKYKLVFLDPPYNSNLLNPAIELVADIRLLEKKSLLVCETEKNFQINTQFIKYIKYEKYYGKIKLLFLDFH